MDDGRSQASGPTVSIDSIVELLSSLEREARRLVPGTATTVLLMLLRLLENSGFAAAFREALSGAGWPGQGVDQSRLDEELASLREKSRRFEEAVQALARTQGRCLAKLEDNGDPHGVGARLDAFEQHFGDFKTAHRSNTQGVLDGFEGIRERLARLETRSSEMSREAQAKSGRLDALSRHAAAVEHKIDTALGSPRTPAAVDIPAPALEPGKTVQANR